jgi:hypothetical protein
MRAWRMRPARCALPHRGAPDLLERSQIEGRTWVSAAMELSAGPSTDEGIKDDGLEGV